MICGMTFVASDILVASSLNGLLFRVSFERCTFTDYIDTMGGCGWDLTRDPRGPHRVAAACEDGTLRTVVLTEDEGLQYVSATRVCVSGRCVCVAFLQKSFTAAVGCDDGTIRLVSKTSNTRLSLGKDVVTWSLADIDGVTFCSGDSLGRMTVWDAVMGVALQQFPRHDADILKIVASPTKIFAAGVDSKIVALEFHDDAWLYSRTHRPHGLDVRGLVLFDSKLVSGGLDAKICALDLTDPNARPRRYWPFPYDTRATVVGRVVAVNHGDHLVIGENGQRLLRLDAKAPRNFSCFGLKPYVDHQLGFAVSDGVDTAVLEFAIASSEDATVTHIQRGLPAAHALKFFPDDRLALSDATQDRVLIFDPSGRTILVSVDLAQSCCSILAVGTTKFAVAAPLGYVIEIHDATATPVKRLTNVLAMAYSDDSLLVATQADGLVWKDSSCSSSTNLLAKANAKLQRHRFSVIGIDASSRIVAWSHAFLLIARHDHDDVVLSTRYQPLLTAASLPPTDPANDQKKHPDVIVVESPWIHVANAQQLRPLKRKRFGR